MPDGLQSNTNQLLVDLLNKSIFNGMLSASRCYKILPVSYLAFADHPRLESLQVFGCLRSEALAELKERLAPIAVNEFMFSAVARPTVGTKRTSLWGIQVRENVRP